MSIHSLGESNENRASSKNASWELTPNLCRDEFVADILPCISCVVIGPGPGSPHKTSDFSWPKRLIQEFGNILPIFGVCLGHQGLATAFGGEVSFNFIHNLKGFP